MTWQDDAADLRRMARDRRTQYGDHDDLAASFERIAQRIEHDHLKRMERFKHEPDEPGTRG